ncbi:MAG: hypothetical protein ACE5HI_10025 [bacterium]
MKNFIYKCVIVLLIINMPDLVIGQEEKQNTKEELKKLREKVAELEKIVTILKTQLDSAKITPSNNVEQSELEKQLAQELGLEEQERPAQTETVAVQISQETISSRRKFFQNMNPNISVIGTLLGSGTSLDAEARNVDLSFEEGEFSFQAVVDPYAKADFYISFGKHNESILVPQAETGEEASAGLEPEIEEAFVTLLSLPFALQLKAGKFRSKFGKINETHPHAYNFINLPLIYSNYFGPEGLNDEGASLSWLVPNRSFFQELTLQVTSGPAENASFLRAIDNHLLYLAHLKSLFDLNDNTTMELGLTGLTGPHNSTGESTQIFAADLTFKWKPIRFNRYKSFEFMNEFLLSKRNGVEKDVTSFGLYSFLRYQIAKRWFVGAMYDYSEFPEFNNFHHQAFSGILQFFTTEFQKFEVQYRYNQGDFFSDFSDFKIRAVFVIGAHGAHQY